MGIYSKYVLPKAVHFACGMKPNARQREKVVPMAAGRVLEIGAGSGLNLPYYDPTRVEHLFALEPSEEMWVMAEEKLRRLNFPIEYLSAPAEAIPLERGAVDSIVVTYSLCTIPDIRQALAEMRRVLRNNGEVIFCEHGLAPDESVRKWQDRINPTWKRLGGGCNLNRDIPSLLDNGGFRIKKMDTMYLPGLKPMTFNYWGVAY